MTAADQTKPTTLRMQATKRPRPLWFKILIGTLKWGTLGGLALAAIGTATLAILFWVYGSDPDLPRINALRDYHPKQTTRILSADGKVIGELYEERRTYVPID